MQRRIFIGINLPVQVKKRLVQKIQAWQELPILWVPEENFHITLSFLGYINDEAVSDICAKISKACRSIAAFDINFNKIIAGPDSENPKMFWLTGKPSEELKNLQESIEKGLGIFQKEKIKFQPHVTLGRIKRSKWKTVSPKPKIDEKFEALIPAESVEILESKPGGKGREYFILESCPLK